MAIQIGYRIVSFDMNTHRALSLQSQRPINITPGMIDSPPGGLYLGTSPAFLDYYRDLSYGEDVLLSLEYNTDDIISGTTGNDSEVVVLRGRLISAQFDNPDVQKQHGQLLKHQPMPIADQAVGRARRQSTRYTSPTP